MRAVGIRELKNKLSEYVRLVEAGESVLVTDRGMVVAELRAAGSTTVSTHHPVADPMSEMCRAGLAIPGAVHDPDLYQVQSRVLAEGQLEALLEAERSEG